MKQKIKEALQQEYKNLGLDETTFDGVASSVETIITDDAQIATFVKGAESMLKRYQSVADKDRTIAANYKKQVEDLEAKLKEQNPAKVGGGDDITELVKKAVADVIATTIQPLQDKIVGFESARTVEQTIETTKSKFFETEWAKSHKDVADMAWETSMEIYEVGGKKSTPDELFETAKSKFDRFATSRGIEKPFEGANAGASNTGFSVEDAKAERQRLVDAGKLPAKN
jgi:hypothetical protein